MSLALSNYIQSRPWASQFLRNSAITAVINVMIALFLTYVLRIGGNLYENLVFSFCIGTLTWLFIDGGRLLLWGTGRPTRLWFFFLCLIAILGARILGEMMAVNIIGIPANNYIPMWEQKAPRFFILTIWISICITWFFWNRGKVADIMAQCEAEKARAAAIEKQAIQAQLQLLQAQIEPHMLFNTLANLQCMIAIDPTRAQHMLDQLILYLRATLSSSRAEEITLDHEFSSMQAYLELMSVRMGSRLSYSLRLPDALREVQIPPMLLQPLVENAIKHGIEPKIEGGRIEVLASAEEQKLRLSVTDTGLGLESPENTDAPRHNGTNVGLANVRERLQALYGERASFSLTPNEPTGVIAQLIIPL
jgi:signal transduction histidine kinase